MKAIASIIMLFCSLTFVLGQPLFVINTKADFIEVDRQQNVYIIKGSTLQKFSSTGKLLYAYSDKLSGSISSVDVSNPLKLLVFYKASNSIVFLNQQLSPVSDVVNIFDVVKIELAAAGASSGGGFWALNYDNQSLIQVTDKWQVQNESTNLSSWLNGGNVLFIREINQQVYLGLHQKVLVFDIYGSYITTIHFKGAQIKGVIGNALTYGLHEKAFVFNINLRNEEEVALPIGIEAALRIQVDKTNIYVLKEKSIEVYRR